VKILVVEDDAIIRESLCELLDNWGYAADGAGDGVTGLDMALGFNYDLLILDLNMPMLDGLSVCRQIRQKLIKQPLIMLLTARDTHLDIISGLGVGADEYIVKPFAAEVLHAQIKALLRRAAADPQSRWQWGKLELLADGHKASWNQVEIKLTGKEHLILEQLLKAQGGSCSKDSLLNAGWSWSEVPGEETVKTHVKNLRCKLSKHGAPVDLIETVYGIGFRMNPMHAS
jgi:DNA-binding response OmpR family regulator